MKALDYHIVIGNATDIGKIREQNEDYLAHFDTVFGYCVIICDGMGGHNGGQVAAHSAIAAIQQFLQDAKNKNSQIPAALRNAIEFANFQLREMVVRDASLKGMGTTCILVLISDGMLYTAHAGDSRAYLLRENNIEQITKDHSSVQQLIDIGVLTEKEASLSDKKNQIIKAIGVFEKVNPAITETPLHSLPGDRLLLCSDGLTAHVNNEAIAKIILSNKNVQDAALQLVRAANEGGGTDNITVQVIQYDSNSAGSIKKKKRKLKAGLLFFVFILLALGFIGYKKYIQGPAGNISSPKKDTIKQDYDTLNKVKVKPASKRNDSVNQKQGK